MASARGSATALQSVAAARSAPLEGTACKSVPGLAIVRVGCAVLTALALLDVAQTPIVTLTWHASTDSAKIHAPALIVDLMQLVRFVIYINIMVQCLRLP